MASGGVHPLLQQASKNIHKQKATFHFASLILRRILSNMSLKQQNSHLYQVHQAKVKWKACPLKYHNKVPNKHQSKISSWEQRVEISLKTTEIECKGSESTLRVQDQVLKAETLWALKTASDNIPFRTTDGIPELFQKMFVDSTIA